MTSPITLDFDQIFNAFIAANQKKWGHDRSQTLGASEVFGCLRQAFFNKRGKEFGFTPDEDYSEDWGALTRGNLIENHHVVPALRDHMPEGLEVLYTGEDQKSFVHGRSSATPDGLITGLPQGCSLRVKAGDQDILIENIVSDCVTLEIKSIDPRATLLEERTKHNGQTQVQLGLYRECTKWRPEYSIILYIDASFLSKVTPFVVKFDQKVYDEAIQRAIDVWDADKPVDIMPEGRFSGDCQYCRWRLACGTATVNAIPKYDDDPQATPETVEKKAGLVTDFFEKKKHLADAERATEIAQDRIKEFLMQRNTRKMRSGEWNVSWYSQPGKKSVDLKSLEASGVDLEPFQRQGAPFDVLRVTPKLQRTKKDTE